MLIFKVYAIAKQQFLSVRPSAEEAESRNARARSWQTHDLLVVSWAVFPFSNTGDWSGGAMETKITSYLIFDSTFKKIPTFQG